MNDELDEKKSLTKKVINTCNRYCEVENVGPE